MSYSDEASFVESFGSDEAIRLTNLDDPAAPAIDSEILDKALDDAAAEIDPYVAGPLTPVPPVLIRISNDIARYRLDKYQPREDVRQRYEDAMRFLRDVSSGKASLGPEAVPRSVARSLGVVRKFSADTLGDYAHG